MKINVSTSSNKAPEPMKYSVRDLFFNAPPGVYVCIEHPPFGSPGTRFIKPKGNESRSKRPVLIADGEIASIMPTTHNLNSRCVLVLAPEQTVNINFSKD